ncbi:hypothetical protein C8J56DRAFT_886368 [Mycena floridula]|nr:hypothetical protein C8J56DRAFT_886368 [Mycena floridula]
MTRQLPSVQHVLDELRDILDNTMIYVHQLQTASVQRNNGVASPLLRQQFGRFRSDLRTIWHATRQPLETGSSFCTDALTLGQNVGVESDDECYQFLSTTMVPKATTTCIAFQECKLGSARLMDVFDAFKDDLTQFLSTEPVAPAPYYPSIPEYDFHDSIAPDGLEALSELQVALNKSYQIFDSLHQFWLDASEQCRALLNSQLSLPQGDPTRYHEEIWKSNKEAMRAAISLIVPFCDRIIIEPPVLQSHLLSASPRSQFAPSPVYARPIPQAGQWKRAWRSLFSGTRRNRDSITEL